MWTRVQRVSSRDRTLAERLNDGSLEMLIAVARVVSIVLFLGLVASAVCFTWTLDGRWIMTLVLCLVFGGLTGWFGFWQYGNAEWKRDGKR